MRPADEDEVARTLAEVDRDGALRETAAGLIGRAAS